MASADETPPAASVAIVSMSVDRLVSAGELLASSYAEYPAWRYVFPDPDNVAFYERFGFEVANAALPLLPGGPTQWGLRRPAKTTA
jgi:hypothetical protein